MAGTVGRATSLGEGVLRLTADQSSPGSFLLLRLIGALGAHMSRRAGGSARTVFLSIVFPILPYLAFFLIGLPVALILDDHVAHNITIPAFFVGLSAWVIFPAAALLAGGWPVHFFASRRLISSRSAGS